MDNTTTTILNTESGAIEDMTASQPSLLQIGSTADLEPAKKRIKLEENTFVGPKNHVELSIHPLRHCEQADCETVGSATGNTYKEPFTPRVIPSNERQITQSLSAGGTGPNSCVVDSSNTSKTFIPQPKSDLNCDISASDPESASKQITNNKSSIASSVTVSPGHDSVNIPISKSTTSAIQAPVPIRNAAAESGHVAVVTSSTAAQSQSMCKTSDQAVAEAPSSIVGASKPEHKIPHVETQFSQDNVTFQCLRHKYLGELEYMLREFQKLERQLLGAKVQNTEESAGSKERREKLHSFIVHLEETMQQIVSGCELESKTAENPESSNQGEKEKLDSESAQKLEDHILANLLPVKVRLKRQLAAQQGAKHNPAGMPAVRGGMQQLQAAHLQGKATFLRPEVAAERRASIYGKGVNDEPKPHAPTLNPSTVASSAGADSVAQNSQQEHTDIRENIGTQLSANRNQLPLNSVSVSNTPNTTNIASVKASSKQPQRDSLCQNHVVSDCNPTLKSVAPSPSVRKEDSNKSNSTTLPNVVNPVQQAIPVPKHMKQQIIHKPGSSHPVAVGMQRSPVVSAAKQPPAVATLAQSQAVVTAQQVVSNTTTEQNQCVLNEMPTLIHQTVSIKVTEERRRLKRRRKKKKRQSDQIRNHIVTQVGEATIVKRSKRTQSQRGPRNVEYTCALCNEVYNSTCDYNPWWALTQHDCPKCCKLQIPRIDISAPANAIEYHPALLAHAEENGGTSGVNSDTPAAVTLTETKSDALHSDSESDLSDDDGILSDADESVDASESGTDDLASMSIGEQAENEKFGAEYEGPQLSEYDASRLLILVLHASTCPGHHKTENHDNVCRSTKWMMLHTRDCPGTTSTGDVCPFPWCRKVKHLLYHLVSCEHPEKCLICSPIGLSSNIKRLKAISDYRLRRRKIRHAPVDSVNVNSSGAAPVSCVEVVQTQVYPQSNCSNYTSGNENSITPVVEMTKGIAFNETRIGTSSQVPEILSSSVCTSTDSRERIHVGDVHGPSLKIEQDDVNTARHSDVAPSNILGSNVAEDREVCQMSSSPTTYAIGQDTGVGSHPTMVTEGERNLGGPLQPCNIAIVTSVGPNEIVKFSPDISYGLPVSNVGNDSSLRDVVNLHVSNVDEVQSHLPDNFCAIPLIAAGSNKSTCTPSHVAAVITNQDPPAFSKPTLLAMNSSQVVSASDTGSENAIAPNVFGTLNNTTYPSSDSLQSALAPFLTDHVDAADFQSEGLNCRIETSASLAAIASEFEESMLPWTRPVCAKTEVASEVNQERTTDVVDTLVKLEDSDSDVPYNQKLESKCISDERTMSFNPILIPVCKMEESFITQQIGEVSMIPPQQIEGSSVESNNSNAALTHATSTNTLSSSCKVEPSEIRKDRVSSESLVLRVQ